MMKNNKSNNGWEISRRTFLKAATVSTFGLSFAQFGCTKSKKCGGVESIRFGMVADVHYADIENYRVRYYRESLAKMAECVDLMNTQNVDFLIELGDFKDQKPNKMATDESTLSYLRKIESEYQKFAGPTYHALGNHDMDSLSKEQFLSCVKNTGISPADSYYSYDFKSVHFIVLDANFRSDNVAYDHGNYSWKDPNVPQQEIDWLKNDLAKTDKQVIVFCHQLLEGEGDDFVNNAGEIRSILEKSGKVLGVFQGHLHLSRYSLINDIHYYTLDGMIVGSGEENNAYATVEVFQDGSMEVVGYRRVANNKLPAKVSLSRL